MPTPGERIATIEERLHNLSDDVRELRNMIGDRSEPDSVRGRLHKIEGLLGSVVMRRNPAAILAGWQKVLLTLCAVATVAASWYAALAH